MQAGNLKLVGATIALAALVSGCSEPTTNDSSEPAFPRANVTVPNGQFAACKFTVLPGTETLDGTYSSGTVALTVNGQKIGGDSLVEWPTGTQCRFFTLPAGADLTVALTETPSSGSALYFWRYLINDAAQDPYTRLVPGGATPNPFTMTVTGVNAANNYQIYLKNVPYTPPPPPSGGNEGCTPGYWKQSQHFDSWAFYTTSQSFNTVFGGTYFTPDITLLQALGRNGGGINALARHSVAALLNATNGTVDYPDEDTASIIADFQAAVAGGASTIEAQKNTFDRWNNGAGGCPLN
jgi:hypothetical protein